LVGVTDLTFLLIVVSGGHYRFAMTHRYSSECLGLLNVKIYCSNKYARLNIDAAAFAFGGGTGFGH
tara:strand:- start:43776 stop:43973 length:198 start_codon:yes stop_codon:yes gene_type:complete